MVQIDTNVINAFFMMLIGGIGGLLTTWALSWRNRSAAETHEKQVRADGLLATDKARADGYILQERTSNTATETLAKIAERGVDVQERMVQTVADLGRVMNDNAAQMRGMLLMQDDHTKALRNVSANVDEVSGVIPKIDTKLQSINDVTSTLETDIGESISQQFGPIVIALTEIGAKLTELVNAVSAKDNEINARLNVLITDFHSAETRLMKALEPIVLKHINDFLPVDTSAENGKGNEEIHEASAD